MKKTLLIFTGGTIGSTNTDGLIDVNSANNYKLISLYKEKYSTDVVFEAVDLMQVLSENITAKHWEKLCNYLLSISFDDYAGIIITHGSDTLAFTSALIGTLFAHTQIPICLVAADKPLDEPASNGVDNLAKAVDIIQNRKTKGIFTVFDSIFPATRVMPADSCLDKFSTYGNVDIEAFYKQSQAHKATKLPIDSISFEHEILMIYGYPNINFSAYALQENTSAVLYVPYHSGTACVDSDSADKSFVTFIKACKELGVPVYMSGIKSLDSKYTTLDTALDAGAIPLVSISEVAAYAKLMIAYNQDKVSVDELLSKNIYYEIAE